MASSTRERSSIQYWLPGVGARQARRLPRSSGVVDVADVFADRSRVLTPDGLPMAIYVDEASALGRRFTNTSKLRWSRPPDVRPLLVLYLAPGRERDSYVVSHELAHNILYCQGLPRVDLVEGREDERLRLLLSSLSSSSSHFLVNRVLSEHGFDVVAREGQRARQFIEVLPRGRRVAPARVALDWLDLASHTSSDMAHRLREAARGEADAFAQYAEQFEQLAVRIGLRNAPSIAGVQRLRHAILARLSIQECVAMRNPLRCSPSTQETGEDGAALAPPEGSPSNLRNSRA